MGEGEEPSGKGRPIVGKQEPGVKCLPQELHVQCVFDDLLLCVDCQGCDSLEERRCSTVLFPVLGI